MNIRSAFFELLHADGQTDIPTPTGALLLAGPAWSLSDSRKTLQFSDSTIPNLRVYG
jgi:hypothetical protein